MAFYTYKFIIHPTKGQSQLIDNVINSCYFLRTEYKKDIKNNSILPVLAKDILNFYINKFHSLRGINKMLLIGEIFRINQGRTRNSFSFSNTNFIASNYPIRDDHFFIPGIGWVKKGNYRKSPNMQSIKYFTVLKKSEKYYLLIIFNAPNQRKVIDNSSIIGFDYSSTHFLVDNNGKFYDIPRFQKDVIATIKSKTNQLRRCQKGSNNYKKLKKEISKLYIYSKNKRLDCLHKLSTEIVNKYDNIIIEDLSMKEIASGFNLYFATFDNSFYKFTEMLKYKAESKGKRLIKVNRYFPSTKMCHKCGYINNSLTIKDRIWICPECNSVLDRDVNSAINIKNEGLRIIAAGRSAC